MFSKIIFTILVASLIGVIDCEPVTGPPQHDQCIDSAFVRFHQALTTKFPQFENFTVSLPSSRHLFQSLLFQNFTNETFTNYCRAYEAARKEYDQCNESDYKRVVMSGFGLADYICLKRLNDYASGIQCLDRADKTAADACRPKCAQYEQASYSYLHPTDAQTNDMTTFMAGDCLYLKCWVSCRAPMLAQYCDNKTVNLEMDSLRIGYSALHDLYEPVKWSTPAPGQRAPHFPEECKLFVDEDDDGKVDHVLVTSIGTTIVVAGGTSTVKTQIYADVSHAPGGGAINQGPTYRVVTNAIAVLFVVWTMTLN